MNDLERVVYMKNVKHGLLAILVLAVTPVALAKVEIENRSTQNVEELGVEQIAKSMELGNELVVEDVANGVAISGNGKVCVLKMTNGTIQGLSCQTK